MNVRAYYNEWDSYAADWLERLIAAEFIAPGDVDRRSIKDVQADDLRGYSQCHFFAGIGGWSYAARCAGWPDSRPLWTASLPCQPYSVGSVAHGGARGQEDDRHLLPFFTPLVAECRPPVVLGEQVASAIKWGWLDEAFGALENIGYACGASVVPALAVGAAHERKRIYWMAHSGGPRWQGHQPVECFSGGARTALAVDGDPVAGARRALDGDFSDLLPGDGFSVVLERHAVKGYGNAIHATLATKFILAADEAMKDSQ